MRIHIPPPTPPWKEDGFGAAILKAVLCAASIALFAAGSPFLTAFLVGGI